MSKGKPTCVRCGEGFPVATEPTVWTMGQMRNVTRLPSRFLSRVGYDPADIRGEPHICGACYFDLLDAEEEQQDGG